MNKKQAWHIRWLYFLLFIAAGFGAPWIGYFCKHTLIHPDGTPAIELIKILFFVMPIIGLFASMFSGVIADRLKIGNHIIAYACLLLFVIDILIAQLAEEWTSAWSLTTKFWVMFSLFVVMTIAHRPISPLIEAETMIFLNTYKRREHYGILRLWGTFGWMVSTILMGIGLFLSDNAYAIVYYASAIGFLSVGAITIKGTKAKLPSKPIQIPWEHLQKDHMFKLFLVFVFIYGIFATASFSYISYFFDDVMQNPLHIGLLIGLWTLFEIPIMIFSHTLIKLLGNRWLIVLGLGFTALRFILYSFFTPETPFLTKFLVTLIHGPAYGLGHIGMIDLVDRQAHGDMRHTYMTLYSAALYTLAAAIGGFIGGSIIQAWDTLLLMRVCGIGIIISALFFIFFVHDQKNRQKAPPYCKTPL